jgi:hypothetical protein
MLLPVKGSKQVNKHKLWAESVSGRLELLSSVFRHHLRVRAAIEERAALKRAPGNGALARLRIVLSSPDSSSPSRIQPCGSHHCETGGPSRDHAFAALEMYYSPFGCCETHHDVFVQSSIWRQAATRLSSITSRLLDGRRASP